MRSPALVFLSVAGIVSAQQKLWEKCGGQSWTGTTKCVSGASCIYQNEEDSQCLPGKLLEVEEPRQGNAKHRKQIPSSQQHWSPLFQLNLLNTSRYAPQRQRCRQLLLVPEPSLGIAKPSTSIAKRTRLSAARSTRSGCPAPTGLSEFRWPRPWGLTLYSRTCTGTTSSRIKGSSTSQATTTLPRGIRRSRTQA